MTSKLLMAYTTVEILPTEHSLTVEHSCKPHHILLASPPTSPLPPLPRHSTASDHPPPTHPRERERPCKPAYHQHDLSMAGSSHGELVLSDWRRFQEILQQKDE